MISVGDISKWSKGAVGFKYPEPSNRPAKAPRIDAQLPFSLAHDKAAPEPCVFVGAIESPKKPISLEESDGMDAVAASNFMAAKLNSLVTRRFFT